MVRPFMKFEGADTAKQMNRIFAENLQDLLDKIDEGKGNFERGFFHTSTVQHEGTCFFKETWSRDGGRGLIELARLGFADEAMFVAEYLLKNKNQVDHWGRTVPGHDAIEYEIDGNALIILGLARTWRITGCNISTGKGFVDEVMPVFQWMERLMNACAYGFLLPSVSEMSGNPNTPYQVYGTYGNYCAKEAISAFKNIAEYCGMEPVKNYLEDLEKKLSDSMESCLVSKGQSMLTPRGCWLNGLDGRDGRPYEFSEWDGTSWPVYHWTRQLPYILAPDMGGLSMRKDKFNSVHLRSYEHVLKHMCSGKYFRKYGFVSSTGWTGTGGRHDDTMCGYGQGFMTQAALLTDDINVYTKLLEGITRLGYDGDVTEPLSYEMNPWVMHECFNYENYEEGRDHTFGVLSQGKPELLDNPGDEGNLVQEAEIIKALALAAGVDDSNPVRLRIMPRIPWTWDEMVLKNFPVPDAEGNMARIEFKMVHERWLRKSSFSISSSSSLKNVDVRIGPFPMNTKDFSGDGLEIERSKGGAWIWVRGLSGKEIEREISLR